MKIIQKFSFLLFTLGFALFMSSCEKENEKVLEEKAIEEVAINENYNLDISTTNGQENNEQAPVMRDINGVQSSRSENLEVGVMGSYFFSNINSFLSANGCNVTLMTQSFITEGGLETLDAIYLNRSGLSFAGFNLAAIQDFVNNGGTLITEFTASIWAADNLGACSASGFTESIPAGACGGLTIDVNTDHPLAAGLPASFCSGDQFGYLYYPTNIDLEFEIFASYEGNPLAATCCIGDGVLISYFADFGDMNFGEFSCGGGGCISAPEELQLFLNSVEIVVANSCVTDIDGDGIVDDEDNCPLTANTDQANYDGDAEGDVCDADDDNDGCDDSEDPHPFSNQDATVIIDGCDSGVSNVFVSENGCSNMSDLIADAAAAATNHGGFVSAVAALANAWKKAGIISGSEKGAIQSCASQSNWPL